MTPGTKLFEERGELVENLVTILLGDVNPHHIVWIGFKLDEAMRQQLVVFLQKDANVFTWSPMDMSCIEPELIMHRLNVDPTNRPMKQKKRSFAPEDKRPSPTKKMINMGFIREVNYPDWLANILVRKANGQ